MKHSNDTTLDEKVEEPSASCSTGRIFFSPFTDRALKLSLPFILWAVYLLFLKYIYVPNQDFYGIFGLKLLYFLSPAGKESVIPLGLAAGFSWHVMAVSLTVIDVLTCMFMVWNFDLLCKAPVLGGWIATWSRAGRKLFNSFPLIERLSVIGLAIFVLLPVPGSGGIASSVFGKVLGLPPWHIFLAVLIGSPLGSIFVALGFHSLDEYFKLGPIFLVGAAVIILLIELLHRHFSNKTGKREEENEHI